VRRQLTLCAFTALALATPALAAVPKPKPKPKATYDCRAVMPASLFGSLTGGSVTLTGFALKKGFFSSCKYGESNQIILNFGAAGRATGTFAFKHWVAGATQATKRDSGTCPQAADPRDCQLTPLAGFGKQAYEYAHSIIALTVRGVFVQVWSPDRSLSYDQEESVESALLAKIK
jgi:hypothetical protein